MVGRGASERGLTIDKRARLEVLQLQRSRAQHVALQMVLLKFALATSVAVRTSTPAAPIVAPQIFVLPSSSPQVPLVRVDGDQPKHQVLSH